MKKLLILAMLVSAPAFADFDSDFAAFEKDFDRLNSMTSVKKQKPKPVVAKQEVDSEDSDVRDMELSKHEVDPTSPDRLGHQLEDERMKSRVIGLYNRPNMKVYSYVLQAE